MLTAIIPTLDSERPLVPTLAALVPGVTAGLLTDAVIVDGGSRDETEKVADIAGCRFLAAPGPLGLRLQAGAEAARCEWLLFLRPGTVLDPLWTADTTRFVEQWGMDQVAAVFRRVAPPRRGFASVMSLFGGRPRPEQGLLIAKSFYRALGGHSGTATDPEADLLRRIGRRRLVTLGSGAFHPGARHPDT
jgi:hypothetical protein